MADENKAADTTAKQETTESPETPPKTSEVVEMPKQKANIPTAIPPSSKSAEVIDLDKVRAEKEKQMRQEAGTIVELCALANQSALAGEFIAKGMDVDTVRKALLSRRASGEEIHSHVMPGDGTRVRPTENLDANPVVVACQKLAKQTAKGE